MRALAITKENLDNQKEAVKQERRLSFDNQPYATAIVDHWPELAFRNWQNSHSLIGSFEDLNAATVEDVARFFKTFYAPNNAVLVIAGRHRYRRKRRSWSRPTSATSRRSRSPSIPTWRARANRAAHARSTGTRWRRCPPWSSATRAAARRSPDYYALIMLDILLTGGESSRFQQNLVKGKKSVIQYEANLGWPFAGADRLQANPAMYAMYLLHNPNFTGAQIVAQVEEEIAKMSKRASTPEELERARTFLRAQRISRCRVPPRAPRCSAQYELFDGNPD